MLDPVSHAAEPIGTGLLAGEDLLVEDRDS